MHTEGVHYRYCQHIECVVPVDSRQLGVHDAKGNSPLLQVHPTLLIVPLFSWYHYSFAGQQARPGRLRFDALCQWPVDECEAVWQLMLAFNKPRIAAAVQRRTSMAASMGCDMGQGGGVGVGSDGRGQGRPTVITCSHFLPRPDLPFHSHVPDLDKVCGGMAMQR